MVFQIILKPFCWALEETLHFCVVCLLKLFLFLFSFFFFFFYYFYFYFLYLTEKQVNNSIKNSFEIQWLECYLNVWSQSEKCWCNLDFSKMEHLIFHISKWHRLTFSKFLLLFTLFLSQPNLFAGFDPNLQEFPFSIFQNFSKWSGCSRGQKKP